MYVNNFTIGQAAMGEKKAAIARGLFISKG
jgi:hypothetical protein